MKLLRIEAHNVKRIKDIVLDLAGHHLFLIGGRNRQGKSSAIDAIEYAICGKKAIPGQPLRRGAESGVVRLYLEGDKDLHQTGLIVERVFLQDGKTEMRLTSDDGFQAPQPQTILNDLYARAGFDPLAFTRMKPVDQVAELQKIVGVNLDALKGQRQMVYERRTAINLKARTLRQRADDMPRYADAPAEPVSIAELLNEMSEATRENSRREAALAEIKRKDAALDRAAQGIEEANQKVRELKAALQAAESTVEARMREYNRLESELKSAKAGAETMQPIDVAPIEQRLRDSEKVNEQVRANAAKVAAQAEAKKVLDEALALTKQIEEIDAECKRRLGEAQWPVEGLGFSDEGVTLNGLPFEQASSAEQLQVSVAMGMAMNPKLRLMVIRDGSLLDNETLASLDELVKAHDYQCLVEVVTRSDEDEERCEVIIEEGSVKVSA